MERDYERLAELVIAARTEMGYTSRAEFCAALKARSGVPSLSLRHLGSLERGKPPVNKFGPNFLARIEKIFGWRVGTCEKILRRQLSEPLFRGSALTEADLAEPQVVTALPAQDDGPQWKSAIVDGGYGVGPIEVGDLIYRIESATDIDDESKKRMRELILGPEAAENESHVQHRHSA